MEEARKGLGGFKFIFWFCFVLSLLSAQPQQNQLVPLNTHNSQAFTPTNINNNNNKNIDNNTIVNNKESNSFISNNNNTFVEGNTNTNNDNNKKNNNINNITIIYLRLNDKLTLDCPISNILENTNNNDNNNNNDNKNNNDISNNNKNNINNTNNNSDVIKEMIVWFKYVSVRGKKRRSDRLDIRGRVMEIEHVDYEDSRDFVCAIEDDPIKRFRVIVNGGPRWKLGRWNTLHPHRMEQVGQDVKIWCKVDSNPPPSYITWYKNEDLLMKHIQPVRKDFILKLHKVTGNDDGRYTCEVGNEFGNISRSTQIDVEVINRYPPIIKNGQPNISTHIDTNVTLSCSVLSDLEFQHYWFFKSFTANISGDNGGNGGVGSDGVRGGSSGGSGGSVSDGSSGGSGGSIGGSSGSQSGSRGNNSGSGGSWDNANERNGNVSGSSNGNEGGSIQNASIPNNDNVTAIDKMTTSNNNITNNINNINNNNNKNNNEYNPLEKHGLWNEEFIRTLGDVISSSDNDYDNDSDVLKLTLYNVKAEMAGMYTCVVKNSMGFNYHSTWVSLIQEESYLLRHHNNSHHKKREFIVFIVPPVIIVVVFVSLVILIFRFCYTKSQQLRFQKELDQHSKKRVVVIRENTLYGQEVTSQSSLLGSPQVKLEKYFFADDNDVCNRNSSDYEIPVDASWEIDRNRLEIDSLLGEGAFGRVVRGVMKGSEGDRVVAVKMLKEGANDEDLLDLVQEMEVMKTIGYHENILALIGCSTQNGPLHVIVEYAMYGNLRDYLKEKRSSNSSTLINNNHHTPSGMENDFLTFKDLVYFSLQISRGLDYLASKMCVHRDVAARNVLVTQNHLLKIGDFGLTRNITKNDYYKKTTDGRLPVKWMAPESLFDRKCTVKSDVWSYGVLLWEVFSMGGSPYPSVPVEKLFHLLRAGYRMEAPVYSSREIYEVMLQCWNSKPSLRPSFSQLDKKFESILNGLTNTNLNSSNYNYQNITATNNKQSNDDIFKANKGNKGNYFNNISELSKSNLSLNNNNKITHNNTYVNNNNNRNKSNNTFCNNENINGTANKLENFNNTNNNFNNTNNNTSNLNNNTKITLNKNTTFSHNNNDQNYQINTQDNTAINTTNNKTLKLLKTMSNSKLPCHV